jgi:hypothetical protein
MKEFKGAAALDAGLLAAAQAVEHYEIARYGTLWTWAQELGLNQSVKLLQATLGEEKKTDETLTQLAESQINQARPASGVLRVMTRSNPAHLFVASRYSTNCLARTPSKHVGRSGSPLRGERKCVQAVRLAWLSLGFRRYFEFVCWLAHFSQLRQECRR